MQKLNEIPFLIALVGDSYFAKDLNDLIKDKHIICKEVPDPSVTGTTLNLLLY